MQAAAPAFTTLPPAAPGDAPARVFTYGGPVTGNQSAAPYVYFTLLQPGQAAAKLSNAELDGIAADLATDLFGIVQFLAAPGSPGPVTVAAVPAPALGERLLTVSGGPRSAAAALAVPRVSQVPRLGRSAFTLTSCYPNIMVSARSCLPCGPNFSITDACAYCGRIVVAGRQAWPALARRKHR